MLDKIKNISFYILLGAAFLAIIIWIYHGCNKPVPPVKQNTVVEDSLREVILDGAKALKQKNDTVALLKTALDSIENSEAHARIDLDEKVKEARTWKIKYELAKIQKDTIAAIVSCDSLIAELVIDSALLGGYENLTDSLITAGRKLSVAQDSAYTLLNQAYFNQQLLTQNLQSDNANLVSANKKLVRQSKISGVIEKIGSVALGVLAVFALVKK